MSALPLFGIASIIIAAIHFIRKKYLAGYFVSLFAFTLFGYYFFGIRIISSLISLLGGTYLGYYIAQKMDKKIASPYLLFIALFFIVLGFIVNALFIYHSG